MPIGTETNRTAFVTGASRGIGWACALALAHAGTRVVVAARDRSKLDEIAAEICAAGVDSFAVAIDLESEESIREAFLGRGARLRENRHSGEQCGYRAGWLGRPNEKRATGMR